jgi:hypothetical protein
MMTSGSLGENHKLLQSAFTEYGVAHNILEWQVKRSEELAAKWFAKHGQPHRGLLFVNKKNEDVKRNKKLLRIVSIGKAEGNNGYAKSNLVVFLAAVNPVPQICTVLGALLPRYDPDEDYVIDKANQCIGRGNIRNHDSDDKMLAIVSTLGMAKALGQLMEGAPEIRVDIMKKLGNYVTWSSNSSRAEESLDRSKFKTREEKSQSQNRLNQQRYSSNPLNRQLASLRKKRARAISNGDAKLVTKVNAEIEKITKQRDDQKKGITQ